MGLDFEDYRSERRSFFCPNKLWKELKVQTKGCISISEYVRSAILEKMIHKEPCKKEYFKELV